MKIEWYQFKIINSTQTYATKLASTKKLTKPILITATQQTNGYGTKSQIWQSPPGNLYATFCIKKQYDNTIQFSIIAAEYLKIAIKEITNKEVEIKEPNDLMYKGKKCSGILCTWITDLEGSDILCIGIGFNTKIAPKTTQPTIAIKCNPKDLILRWIELITSELYTA